MRKPITRVVALVTSAWLLSACAGFTGMDTDSLEDSVVSVSRDELPTDVAHCDAVYGQSDQWPTPDAVYRIDDEPLTGILVHQGAVKCSAPINALLLLAKGNLGENLPGNLRPLDGDLNAPADDSNPLPARPDSTASASSGEADDSNPLPAFPGGRTESASSGSPVDDSNPLPAGPAPTKGQITKTGEML